MELWRNFNKSQEDDDDDDEELIPVSWVRVRIYCAILEVIGYVMTASFIIELNKI